MLDLEPRLHPECSALLDREGVLVQVFQCAGLSEVDDDVAPALDFETEREDDDLPRVARVGDAFASAEAERLLPFAEGFVVGVCGWVA